MHFSFASAQTRCARAGLLVRICNSRQSERLRVSYMQITHPCACRGCWNLFRFDTPLFHFCHSYPIRYRLCLSLLQIFVDSCFRTDDSQWILLLSQTFPTNYITAGFRVLGKLSHFSMGFLRPSWRRLNRIRKKFFKEHVRHMAPHTLEYFFSKDRCRHNWSCMRCSKDSNGKRPKTLTFIWAATSSSPYGIFKERVKRQWKPHAKRRTFGIPRVRNCAPPARLFILGVSGNPVTLYPYCPIGNSQTHTLSHKDHTFFWNISFNLPPLRPLKT